MSKDGDKKTALHIIVLTKPYSIGVYFVPLPERKGLGDKKRKDNSTPPFPSLADFSDDMFIS